VVCWGVVGELELWRWEVISLRLKDWNDGGVRRVGIVAQLEVGRDRVIKETGGSEKQPGGNCAQWGFPMLRCSGIEDVGTCRMVGLLVASAWSYPLRHPRAPGLVDSGYRGLTVVGHNRPRLRLPQSTTTMDKSMPQTKTLPANAKQFIIWISKSISSPSPPAASPSDRRWAS